MDSIVVSCIFRPYYCDLHCQNSLYLLSMHSTWQKYCKIFWKYLLNSSFCVQETSCTLDKSFTYYFFSNFSDLQEDLSSIQSNIARSQFCSQRLLCRTLAGNNVYILTITSPASEVSFLKKKIQPNLLFSITSM